MMTAFKKAWMFLKQEDMPFESWPDYLLHVLGPDDEPVIIESEKGDDPRTHPIIFDPKDLHEGGYGYGCSNCGVKPHKCTCPCRQCGGYSTPENEFNHPRSLEWIREDDPTATACQCPEHGGNE